MKILSQSNDTVTLYTIDIVVNYVEYINSNVSASIIQVDKEELQTCWEDFIDSIYGKIAIRRFKIVDEHESNRPESNSYYIVFYPRTSKGELRTDLMIQLRISDHKLNQNSKTRRAKVMYEEEIQKLYSEDEESPVFEVQGVVVGSKNFPNTSKALTYIEYLCRELQHKNTYELTPILEDFLKSYVEPDS